MLLVTHDMNAVLTLCDHAVWLHEGSLVEIGKPKKIVDMYTQAFYEGGPPELSSETFRELSSEILSKNMPGCASDSEEKITVSQPPLPELENNPAIEVADAAITYGAGEVKISKVAFFSHERGPVDAVYGGEVVSIHIWLEALKDIKDPVVGFLAKNKLGLEIFGFNSITLQTEFPPLRAGDCSLVEFEFTWPMIASDNYAITIAIADGDMEQCTMHHMVQDVMMIEVLRTQEYQIGLVSAEKVRVDIKLLDTEAVC